MGAERPARNGQPGTTCAERTCAERTCAEGPARKSPRSGKGQHPVQGHAGVVCRVGIDDNLVDHAPGHQFL
jgi:hypothetical protein